MLRKPPGASAHDGAHVEVLDAVVGGMSREDARLGERTTLVLAHRAQRLVGGQVALAPGHGFHVLAAALGFGSDVDGADEQRDIQRLGQSRHEALVGIGVLAAQLVVHVQHGHRSHIARLAQGSAKYASAVESEPPDTMSRTAASGTARS